MRPGISLVIPTIPPRQRLLERALASVFKQVLAPAAIHVITDTERAGAAATRQRGLEMVDTELVAFLDDDDELKPRHLQALHELLTQRGADYAFSWFDVVGGRDPFPPVHGTRDWDDARPQHTTITVLVRTELAQGVGFRWPETERVVDGQVTGEDWSFTVGCLAAGAKIVRTPERTWLWHHDSGNTSGLPSRW